MPTLRGWLFFVRLTCRITFVPEDTRDEPTEELAWYVLSRQNNWQEFLAHFDLEGLETERGYQVYLKTDLDTVRTWLAERACEPS